jgi:hypothetical protein
MSPARIATLIRSCSVCIRGAQPTAARYEGGAGDADGVACASVSSAGLQVAPSVPAR